MYLYDIVAKDTYVSTQWLYSALIHIVGVGAIKETFKNK